MTWEQNQKIKKAFKAIFGREIHAIVDTERGNYEYGTHVIYIPQREHCIFKIFEIRRGWYCIEVANETVSTVKDKQFPQVHYTRDDFHSDNMEKIIERLIQLFSTWVYKELTAQNLI